MWDEIGRLQLEFLISQGLEPTHYLLDVGCGSLRGGVQFIRYLEDGHYYGIDKDSKLLEAGASIELVRAGLTDRTVTLVQMEDFGFQSLCRQFDYAIAQSVFTHLPLNSIIRCVMNIEKVLVPGGRFFATYFENPGGKYHLEPILQPHLDDYTFFDRDPYHYDFNTFEIICQGTDLDVSNLGDWSHPRGQRMMMFTKR